jgi:hypothetical protein
MNNFKSSLNKVHLSVKKLDKEFVQIVKKIETKSLLCNVNKTNKYLSLLNIKISKLNSNHSHLTKLKKQILAKEKMLAKEKILAKEKEVVVVKLKEPTIKVELPKVKPPVTVEVKKSNLSLEREDRGYKNFDLD